MGSPVKGSTSPTFSGVVSFFLLSFLDGLSDISSSGLSSLSLDFFDFLGGASFFSDSSGEVSASIGSPVNGSISTFFFTGAGFSSIGSPVKGSISLVGADFFFCVGSSANGSTSSSSSTSSVFFSLVDFFFFTFSSTTSSSTCGASSIISIRSPVKGSISYRFFTGSFSLSI